MKHLLSRIKSLFLHAHAHACSHLNKLEILGEKLRISHLVFHHFIFLYFYLI